MGEGTVPEGNGIPEEELHWKSAISQAPTGKIDPGVRRPC